MILGCYSSHEPLLLDSLVQIKLWKSLKLFFWKTLSIRNIMHKKISKISTGCRVSEAKIYLYHSTEIAKARPHREGIS